MRAGGIGPERCETSGIVAMGHQCGEGADGREHGNDEQDGSCASGRAGPRGGVTPGKLRCAHAEAKR